MGTTNFDTVQASSGFKQGDYDFPITERVDVTVGTDFDTFVDAMNWAVNMPTSGSGNIVINLPAGTHLLPEPSEFDEWEWAYYAITNHIAIQGVGASTIITMPDTDDGDQWPTLFAIGTGGFVYLTEVTIDPAAGSYPYPENITIGYSYAGGILNIFYVTQKNCSGGIYASNTGYVFYFEGTIDNMVNGISAYGAGGKTALNGTTISNCTTGVLLSTDAGHSPTVHLKNCTLTSNTADYSVTLNEIQYNGGFISNGSAALTLKA